MPRLRMGVFTTRNSLMLTFCSVLLVKRIHPRMKTTLPCLFIGFLVLVSCTDRKVPTECTEYFNSRARQDINIFLGYETEKQFIIYQCGLDQYPPTDYSFEIARKGTSVIPFLLQELESGKKLPRYEQDKEIYAIVKIFERLSDLGHFKADDPRLHIIERRVATIETPRLKRKSLEALDAIKSQDTLKNEQDELDVS